MGVQNISGLVVSVNRMEKGTKDIGALEEIGNEYGIKTTAIVTMEEIIEHLYNKPYNGKIIIDDDIKARIDEYYEQYGI